MASKLAVSQKYLALQPAAIILTMFLSRGTQGAVRAADEFEGRGGVTGDRRGAVTVKRRDPRYSYRLQGFYRRVVASSGPALLICKIERGRIVCLLPCFQTALLHTGQNSISSDHHTPSLIPPPVYGPSVCKHVEQGKAASSHILLCPSPPPVRPRTVIVSSGA